jgi:hypothetical protein
MNREVHVRFWESPEVKVLRATRQSETPKHVRCGGSFRRKRPWRPHSPMGLGRVVHFRERRLSEANLPIGKPRFWFR